MSMVSMVCTVETNKKGRFELTPHAVVTDVWGHKAAFDIDSLGKYYKIRSDAVQKLFMGMTLTANHYGNVVIAHFSEKKNLTLVNLEAIVKGKEPKMSVAANFVILVKSVAYPTPAAIRKQLEDVTDVKVLFPLTNITYAAVNQTKQPNRIALKMERDVAVNIANILGSNGTVAEVIDDATGEVVHTSVVFGVGAPGAPAAPAKKVEVKEAIEPDYFYVPDSLRHISAAVYALRQRNPESKTAILISGPSGFGKTAFAIPLAKVLGMGVGFFDMSLLVDTEDLFGGRQIENGSTIFRFNSFVEMVEAGNNIIVLDETNRTIASALNAALGLLDWRGTAIVHGRKIVVGPGTVFVATRNVGNEYAGTHNSDAAFTSRFAFSAVIDSIPVTEEVKLLMKRTGVAQEEAVRIVKTANSVREQRELGVNVSPRNTLEIAGLVAAGVHVRCAYQWNVLLKIEDDSTRAQTETLFNRQLGIEYGTAAASLKNIF